MKRLWCCIAFLTLVVTSQTISADSNALLSDIKARIQKVKSFIVNLTIKLEVPNLQAPDGHATMYYIAPDSIRVDAPGFAMIPRQGAGIPLLTLLSSDYTTVDAGTENFRGMNFKRIKILPADENADFVVATVLIDTNNILPVKIRSTTRSGGTITTEFVYDNEKSKVYCLPSYTKLILDIPAVDIPNHVTGELDEDDKKAQIIPDKMRKATVEIWYTNYRLRI